MDIKSKILFYGNCQIVGLKEILVTSLANFEIVYIECYHTEISKQDFDTIIKNCSVIITQPIFDGYRQRVHSSTNYILENCNENCKVFIFPSCYFNFYYFDVSYKRHNDSPLGTPIDYHYNELIKYYIKGEKPESFISGVVFDANFKSKLELDKLAEDSLKEIKTREAALLSYKLKNINTYPIPLHDYIKNNYKDKLLFYSMNHPSKYILQYVGNNILNTLKFENLINLDFDPMNNPRCILYKCIQNSVNFDVSSCVPLAKSKSSIHDIVDLYYKTYSNIGLSEKTIN